MNEITRMVAFAAPVFAAGILIGRWLTLRVLDAEVREFCDAKAALALEQQGYADARMRREAEVARLEWMYRREDSK